LVSCLKGGHKEVLSLLKRLFMKNTIILLFLISSLNNFMSCTPLVFKKDTQFISSAFANSPELLVYFNSKPCKNGEGEIGLCHNRLYKSSDLEIVLKPISYSYKVVIACSSNIGVEYIADVVPDTEFKYTISKERYSLQRVFNCTVTVFPHDRPYATIFAAARFAVVDDKYTPLESIYLSNGVTILGEYSYIVVADGQYYKRKTFFSKQDKKRIIVESYNGRRSYYGY
jgi:hypothetical protein